MITDDTILEKLRWQLFDNNESYDVAMQKYNDILSYVFPSLDTTNFKVEKDGIEIKIWCKDTRCFRGIILNFYDNFERRTYFRCVEFKGTALDFKAKVWQKFETLKSLLQVSPLNIPLPVQFCFSWTFTPPQVDTKFIAQNSQRIAREFEITELTGIAKRAFGKYQVNISKEESGYRLTLEIDFNDKRELVNFCDKENL